MSYTKLGVSLLFSIVLTACGGSSGGGNPTLKGRLIDSPVDGVQYIALSQAQLTNIAAGNEDFPIPDQLTANGGEFNYRAGDFVAFGIGDLLLGGADAAPTILLHDLDDSFKDDDGALLSDATVNKAIFLQSLDYDENPNNGIEVDITQLLLVDLDAIDFDVTPDAFVNQFAFRDLLDGYQTEARIGVEPVDIQAAVEHVLCSEQDVAAGREADGVCNDEDGDGKADSPFADGDADGDGVADSADNCDAVFNPSQENNDEPQESTNQIAGNACDADDDNDGVDDEQELDDRTNRFSADSDGDEVNDNVDKCPGVFDPEQDDLDGDGEGDACDEDIDGDGKEANGGVDLCPMLPAGDPSHDTDFDEDGSGDACDEDDDNDGLPDQQDDSPVDADRDDDEILDGADNCPGIPNNDQNNNDGDALGDVCDADDDNDQVSDLDEGNALTNPFDKDSDGDGVGDAADNCPLVANADQADADGDALIGGKPVRSTTVTDLRVGGDACDADADNDGLLDKDLKERGEYFEIYVPHKGTENSPLDACPTLANTAENNSVETCSTHGYDANGNIIEEENCQADPADPYACAVQYGDADGDEVPDPLAANDSRPVPHVVDNCPFVANPGTKAYSSNPNATKLQLDDVDGDGKGGPCDEDRDGDGVLNAEELDTDPDLADTDDDGFSDGAAVPANAELQANDNCPVAFNPLQNDTDGDGDGDKCDDLDNREDPPKTQTDWDGDGVDNIDDNCPAAANPDQSDTEVPEDENDEVGDGLGNVCDDDDDDDGVPDSQDYCPQTKGNTTSGSQVGCHVEVIEGGNRFLQACNSFAAEFDGFDGNSGAGYGADFCDGIETVVGMTPFPASLQSCLDDYASNDPSGLFGPALCEQLFSPDQLVVGGWTTPFGSCEIGALNEQNGVVFPPNYPSHVSVQVPVPNTDGEKADIELFFPLNDAGEPVISCAEPHPVMMHGPGFSGHKSTGNNSFSSYRKQGITVVSITPRGFGGSSGTVRVMDPQQEGKHYQAVLNWLEGALDWVAYRNEAEDCVVAEEEDCAEGHYNFVNRLKKTDTHNLQLGATGGSYGGGYQFLTLATDPQQRLDVLMPDITWHDLRYSLAPGNVAKTAWDLLLIAGAEAEGLQGNFAALQNQDPVGALPTRGLDPYVKSILAEYAVTGHFPAKGLEWFRYHSPSYWCEAQNRATGVAGKDFFPYQMPAPRLLNTDAVSESAPLEAGPLPPIDPNNSGPQVINGGVLNNVNVLLTQSARDTLFNLNDALWNYSCLERADANVQFLTHRGGHTMSNGAAGIGGGFNEEFGRFLGDTLIGLGVDDGYDPPNADHCGAISMGAARLAWAKRYLLGQPNAADEVPNNCLALNGIDAETGHNRAIEPYELPAQPSYCDQGVADNAVDDCEADVPSYVQDYVPSLKEAVTLVDIPVGASGEFPAGYVPQGAQALAVFELDLNNPQSEVADFATPLIQIKDDAAAAYLLGTPVIDIQISGPEGFRSNCDLSDYEVGGLLGTGCDAIVFVGLSKDGKSLIDAQVLPIRGLGRHRVEMNAVTARLEPGKTVYLMVYGWHPQFIVSPSRDLTLPFVNAVVNELQLPIFTTHRDYANPMAKDFRIVDHLNLLEADDYKQQYKAVDGGDDSGDDGFGLPSDPPVNPGDLTGLGGDYSSPEVCVGATSLEGLAACGAAMVADCYDSPIGQQGNGALCAGFDEMVTQLSALDSGECSPNASLEVFAACQAAMVAACDNTIGGFGGEDTFNGGTFCALLATNF